MIIKIMCILFEGIEWSGWFFGLSGVFRSDWKLGVFGYFGNFWIKGIICLIIFDLCLIFIF